MCDALGQSPLMHLYAPATAFLLESGFFSDCIPTPGTHPAAAFAAISDSQ